MYATPSSDALLSMDAMAALRVLTWCVLTLLVTQISERGTPDSLIARAMSLWLLYIWAVSMRRPPWLRKDLVESTSGCPFAALRQQVPKPSDGIAKLASPSSTKPAGGL